MKQKRFYVAFDYGFSPDSPHKTFAAALAEAKDWSQEYPGDEVEIVEVVSTVSYVPPTSEVNYKIEGRTK